MAENKTGIFVLFFLIFSFSVSGCSREETAIVEPSDESVEVASDGG